MRIGKTDFELEHIGVVHQSVLDVVPEEEAIEESELRKAYERVKEEGKPSFGEIIERLKYLLVRRRIGDRNFYIRRKAWLSSAEVSRRLDVSMRTVQSWGKKGVLGARYVGDRLRFGADQVEEWVRGRRPSSASDRVESSVVAQVWNNEEDAQYDRL